MKINCQQWISRKIFLLFAHAVSPYVQEAKDLNITRVWFFFKSNLVLEDKCLNENEYSQVLVGFLSFGRVKVNYCYACRVLNNEV